MFNAISASVLQLGLMGLRLLTPLVCVLFTLQAAEHPDFSGTWKLTGEATLRVEHHDPELVIETLNKGRRLLQRYTTDGRETMSIGMDGDEFYAQVFWRRGTLLFEIEEHKRGKILRSTETWSLLEGGSKLRRERVTAKTPQGHTSTYSH